MSTTCPLEPPLHICAICSGLTFKKDKLFVFRLTDRIVRGGVIRVGVQHIMTLFMPGARTCFRNWVVNEEETCTVIYKTYRTTFCCLLISSQFLLLPHFFISSWISYSHTLSVFSSFHVLLAVAPAAGVFSLSVADTWR